MFVVEEFGFWEVVLIVVGAVVDGRCVVEERM